MTDSIRTNESLNYSSAVVSFLDRETGAVKTATMYPITAITLCEIAPDGVRSQRTFIAQNGRWEEGQ